MANLFKKIENLIEDFNDTWDIDLYISSIQLWSKDGAMYTPYNNGGRISINPDQDFYLIEEDVIHELGHALMHQLKLTNEDLRMFRDNSPLLHRSTACNKQSANLVPPLGFVSWYATVNGSEDFCETLSCWVSNDYEKTSLYYGDNRIYLNRSKLLQRKFAQIEKILESL